MKIRTLMLGITLAMATVLTVAPTPASAGDTIDLDCEKDLACLDKFAADCHDLGGSATLHKGTGWGSCEWPSTRIPTVTLKIGTSRPQTQPVTTSTAILTRAS